MKPIPFKIPKSDNSSVRVQIDEGAYFYDRLHYHTEIQITAIVKGRGLLYGGNNMIQFGAGDVFIIGSNVPHLLKNAPEYYSETSPGVKAVSLFFDLSSFGMGFFDMGEMDELKRMLHTAKRGIRITGVNRAAIFKRILGIGKLKKERFIMEFLSIISEIRTAEKTFINSELYNLSVDEKVGKRLNDILSYSFKHLHEQIKIEEVAAVASLSRSQFSRYFKTHTGKTYIQFLNELRIESACTLLMEEKNTIEHICYGVGFQNLSNFNRQFKKLKHITPSEYRSALLNS